MWVAWRFSLYRPLFGQAFQQAVLMCLSSSYRSHCPATKEKGIWVCNAYSDSISDIEFCSQRKLSVLSLARNFLDVDVAFIMGKAIVGSGEWPCSPCLLDFLEAYLYMDDKLTRSRFSCCSKVFPCDKYVTFLYTCCETSCIRNPARK